MYFVYFDGGIDDFETAEEAKQNATKILDECREYACDGWDDESLNLFWGKKIEEVQIIKERPKTEDDCFVSSEIDTIQERELVKCEE